MQQTNLKITHIKRISEGFYSQENQERFMVNIISNGDIRIFVKNAAGNTYYNARDGDSFETFAEHCKGMREACNGTVTVSTMADYEYNVIVEDEKGEQYAEIGCMLIYFNRRRKTC